MFAPLLVLAVAAVSSLLAPLLIFVITAAASLSNPAAATTAPLDTGSVRAVAITGAASSIALSTSPDAPYRAVTRGDRKGWFGGWYSSWFFNDCDSAAAMRLDGPVLRIEISGGGWFDNDDCVVTIEANIPAGAVVSVDQPAFMANLNGHFGSISLAGNAVDAAIDGQARDIAISGDAVRARVRIADGEHVDRVSIEAEALDADLRFRNTPAISYKIDALASFVDSSLPNIAGARPSVEIKGKFIRASIR